MKTVIEIIIEQQDGYLILYVKNNGSISLQSRGNNVESWIELKRFALDLTRVLRGKFINQTKYA